MVDEIPLRVVNHELMQELIVRSTMCTKDNAPKKGLADKKKATTNKVTGEMWN